MSVHDQSPSLKGTFHRASSLMFILTLMAAPAQATGPVNWEQLNLSPQQSNQIERIESEWERQRALVSDQIERDKAELKALLPNGDRDRIQFLQKRITHNQMYLLNESLDTFLDKRDVLQPVQRARLQKMLPAAAPAAGARPAGR